MGRYRQPRFYQLHAARLVDRELPKDTRDLLKTMPETTLMDNGFDVVHREFAGDAESQFTRMSDMYLLFDRGGERVVTFRFPVAKVTFEDVRGYLTNTRYGASDALTAEVDGESLYLQWRIYGEDNEGATPGWTGTEWPDLILPAREEILSGDHTALEIGPLLKDWCDPTEPGQPAEAGVSKAVRNLVAYMCIMPPAFKAWARKRAAAR